MSQTSLVTRFPVERRTILGALGGAALAALGLDRAPAALAQCTLTASPSLTEGPYFVDEDAAISDLRIDPTDGSVQPGYPLALTVNVSQIKDCAEVPLAGAYIDIWHCNATGIYSDVAAMSTVGRKFLRGYQPTNRQGNGYFLTIYPGWYQGRAVHIHVKVRVFDGRTQTYEFTSQFFFDDSFSDEIYLQAPYAAKGQRDTLNANDSIYQGSSSTGTAITSGSGSYLLLTLRKKDGWVEADARLLVDLSLGSSPDDTPTGGGDTPGGGGTPPDGTNPGGAPPNGGTPPTTPP